MAEKTLKYVDYRGGREEKITNFGILLIFLAGIGLIVCIVMAGNATKLLSFDEWGKNGIDPYWIALGIAVFLESLIVLFIFTAYAEIIRLLKKLNGLGYGGNIAGELINVYYCSECGYELPVAEATVCANCQAKFDS